MGMALWMRDAAVAAEVEIPNGCPAAWAGCKYRIEVFGVGRAPWRSSPVEAMQDAIVLDLASWDESVRQWFLAVPVDMRVEKPERA